MFGDKLCKMRRRFRADVKRTMKQRLLDRYKNKSERQVDNYTGGTSSTTTFGCLNLPSSKPQLKLKHDIIKSDSNGSLLAKAVHKLWSMRKHPPIHRLKQFVFEDRVPCFLARNIRRVKRKKRRARRRKTGNLLVWKKSFHKQHCENVGKKEFYFRFKHNKNNKRSARTRLSQRDAKKLRLEPECRKPQSQPVATTEKVFDDCPNLLFSSDSFARSAFEASSNSSELLSHRTRKEEIYEDDYSNSILIQKTSTSQAMNCGSDIDKGLTNEKSLAVKLDNERQLQVFSKRCKPRNFSSVESSNRRSRRRTSARVSDETTGRPNLNSQITNREAICESCNDKEDSFNVFDRKENAIVYSRPEKDWNLEKGRHLCVSENENNQEQNSNNRMESVKDLRISLQNSFASGIQERELLGQGSIPTTSTPKRFKIHPNDCQIFNSAKTSRVTNPRPCHNSERNKYPRVPNIRSGQICDGTKSTILPNSYVTPPDAEVSCAGDEVLPLKVFENFLDDSQKAKKEVERLVYKPLFLNRSRLWKSVVVEND